jgi:hypothetical protein
MATRDLNAEARSLRSQLDSLLERFRYVVVDGRVLFMFAPWCVLSRLYLHVV